MRARPDNGKCPRVIRATLDSQRALTWAVRPAPGVQHRLNTFVPAEALDASVREEERVVLAAVRIELAQARLEVASHIALHEVRVRAPQ